MNFAYFYPNLVRIAELLSVLCLFTLSLRAEPLLIHLFVVWSLICKIIGSYGISVASSSFMFIGCALKCFIC